MRASFRKYLGIVLLVVYVCFYASANLFYHAHVMGAIKIVHSHPFTSATHNHTANQIQMIEEFDSIVYQNAQPILIHECISDVEPIVRNVFGSDATLQESDFEFLLRAPPYSALV